MSTYQDRCPIAGDDRYVVLRWMSPFTQDDFVFPWRFYFDGVFVSAHKTHKEVVNAAREHNRARLKQ
jgi:hypothetical protein